MNIALRAAQSEEPSSLAGPIGKWMERLLGPGYRKYHADEAWMPAINLCEDGTRYCIVAELAGVSPADIEINVEGGKLTLSGCRDVPGLAEVCGQIRLHHMEIDHGRFSRTVDLPAGVDTDHIDASYKSGFLWIHLPKVI